MSVLYQPGDNVHPLIALVIHAHHRLAQGDAQAIRDMLAPDVVWHEWEPSPLAGAYVGRDAVMNMWRSYFGAVGREFHQDIITIMANDDHVSSLVELRGEKGQHTLAQTAVDVMRVTAERRIAEFWRYYADPLAASRFLSAP